MMSTNPVSPSMPVFIDNERALLLARRLKLNARGRRMRRASSCESCICGDHANCKGPCRCSEINHEDSRLAFEAAKLA